MMRRRRGWPTWPSWRTLAVAAALAVSVHAVAALAIESRVARIGLGVIAVVALVVRRGGRILLPTRSSRRSARGSSWLRPALALLLGLVLHAPLVALLFVELPSWSLLGGAPRLPPPTTASAQPADEAPLEIQTLAEEEPARALDEQTEEERREEEQRKAEEEKKDAPGQVVEIARPTLEERPESAKYVAEYDSHVERETRGRTGREQAGSPEEATPPVEKPQPQKRERAAAPSGNPSARPGLPGEMAHRTDRSVGLRGQNGGASSLGPDGESRRPGAPGELPSPDARSRGQNGVPGRRGLPNLSPSQDALERAIGHGVGSPDYLRDIDDGESTALNAKKWKYASFFNRVKRAVADEWHPDVVYLRHDPSGNVYGAKDRVTVVRVHLRADGRLDSLQILQASGVEFLDDEALDAFRRAQPFPLPPQQLVDADGLIHFNFGFIFELSGHTSFKFFKYQ